MKAGCTMAAPLNSQIIEIYPDLIPYSSGAMQHTVRPTVYSSGLASLVPSSVTGGETIFVQLRTASLSSGDAWLVDLYGDRLLSFGVDRKAVAFDHAANSGTIEMTAGAARRVLDSAINLNGFVDARSFHVEGGNIVLDHIESGAAALEGWSLAQDQQGSFIWPKLGVLLHHNPHKKRHLTVG